MVGERARGVRAPARERVPRRGAAPRARASEGSERLEAARRGEERTRGVRGRRGRWGCVGVAVGVGAAWRGVAVGESPPRARARDESPQPKRRQLPG